MIALLETTSNEVNAVESQLISQLKDERTEMNIKMGYILDTSELSGQKYIDLMIELEEQDIVNF